MSSRVLRHRGVLLLAAAIPATFAVVTTVRMGAAGYRSIAVDYPGPLTSLTSAIGRTVVVLASLLCLGSLVTAVLLRPRSGATRLLVERHGAMSLARWSALVWGAGASLLVLVDAADINGQPLSRLAAPGGLVLVEAAYLPRAWLVVAACAGVVLATATLSRTWPANAALLGVASLGVLAPLLVEHVLVGPNHDFAGDATIIGAPAVAAGCGSTVTLFLLGRGGTASVTLLRRYGWLAATCWLTTTATQIVVAAVETEGTPFLSSATGQLFTLQLAMLGLLGGLGVHWWRTGPGQQRSDPAATQRFLGRATLLLAGYVGADLAMFRIPSPQYFVPTSIAQNFLGYDVAAPPTWSALALHWRANLLFATLATIAVGGYLFGARRLARRGDRWPAGRTLAWVSGWLLVVLTTSSGVGRYSGASFSVHMVLHMSLNMFVPVLLVLGGPVTLLLRASPARPSGRPAGPHEWLAAFTGWRLTRSFTHPLHALVSYTTSYYVLYFTDIFNQASRYHWAHEAMNLEFLAIGYLFFSLIIGVDPPPRPLPHLAKLGLVLAAMPFHAFFGVIVMSARGIIAGTFYEYLHSEVTWITNLRHDQYVGGGIAWATGEIPLTYVVIALLVQWSRQDGRQAARLDRHLDAGLDDSYDAYNRMLAQLAAVDARAAGANARAAATNARAAATNAPVAAAGARAATGDLPGGAPRAAASADLPGGAPHAAATAPSGTGPTPHPAPAAPPASEDAAPPPDGDR